MCWCTYSEKQGANTTQIHNPINIINYKLIPILNWTTFISYPPQLLKGVLLICFPTWQNHTNYYKQKSCMDPKPWVIEVAHIHSSYLRIWVMALPYYLYILPTAFSQNRPTISGIFRDPQQWDPFMVSFPYYSHTTPIRIPKDMGIVWETYHKGVPLLGVPGITLDTKLIPFIQSAKDLSNCCFQGLHQPFHLSF